MGLALKSVHEIPRLLHHKGGILGIFEGEAEPLNMASFVQFSEPWPTGVHCTAGAISVVYTLPHNPQQKYP